MKADLAGLRKEIHDLTHVSEAERVHALFDECAGFNLDETEIDKSARALVERLQRARNHNAGVNDLMQEYSLSTPEGVALMCLAEALLRIPDSRTRNELIRDKLGCADWSAHLGHSQSLFVNAGTWSLFIARRWLHLSGDNSWYSVLQRLLSRSSEGLIRRAVELAVALLGQQFVIARNIEEALLQAEEKSLQGYTFSFDMLGEAAACEADALAYCNSYEHAIDVIGSASRQGVQSGHGISVKLSALHPRYTVWQEERVHAELYPRLYALACAARRFNMAFNLDAEESERLELSLDLFTRLAFEPGLSGWNGLGLAVQAYQMRATAVVDYLVGLARHSGHVLQVRLVKGAYWDTEIKRSQTLGLPNFPVFTQKVHTDLSYLCCAERLLQNASVIYPQFATHNAQTCATVQHMAMRLQVARFEMQCLYGMGDGLYSQCRIYAPVGSHDTLLPYLVRRLLENGANTSFVNQIAHSEVNLDSLLEQPVSNIRRQGIRSNAACTPAPRLFGEQRMNSSGLDLHCKVTLQSAGRAVTDASLLPDNPPYSTEAQVSEARRVACNSWATHNDSWFHRPQHRASCLIKAAELLEACHLQLIALLVREAGKTIPDAHAEVREAVDFCGYYASQLLLAMPLLHSAEPRLAVCISPWNFPLAIYIGQVSGALASGHSVIAKPAEQTPRIAMFASSLLHAAGVPPGALQLVFGDAQVGTWLTALPEIDTVLFTGSGVAAKHIERSVLRRESARFPALLVCETGGQNAMVVDSSALPEQAVRDVLESAFGSAGQRCSALRVLCVQSDLAGTLLPLLKAAMNELQVGEPRCISSDLGPLIDHDAWQAVNRHIGHMASQGLQVFQAGRWQGPAQANFMLPTLIELQTLQQLGDEVFGPVLHVLQYNADELPRVLNDLNDTGYALTFGIHSRIQATVDFACDTIHAGNVYVNRNMVGAVVGSQPFGGRGRSGTGPKAGGPHYLPALLRLPVFPVVHAQVLPGPVGEQNLYRCKPRGRVWCTAQQETALRAQIDSVLAAGNVAIVEKGPVLPWPCVNVHWLDRIDVAQIEAAVCECQPALARLVSKRLAHCADRLVPLIVADADGTYPAYRLVQEQVICTNTAAAGGNVELIATA